jgi:hypothetical protein
MTKLNKQLDAISRQGMAAWARLKTHRSWIGAASHQLQIVRA